MLVLELDVLAELKVVGDDVTAAREVVVLLTAVDVVVFTVDVVEVAFDVVVDLEVEGVVRGVETGRGESSQRRGTGLTEQGRVSSPFGNKMGLKGA